MDWHSDYIVAPCCNVWFPGIVRCLSFKSCGCAQLHARQSGICSSLHVLLLHMLPCVPFGQEMSLIWCPLLVFHFFCHILLGSLVNHVLKLYYMLIWDAAVCAPVSWMICLSFYMMCLWLFAQYFSSAQTSEVLCLQPLDLDFSWSLYLGLVAASGLALWLHCSSLL